MSPDWVVKLVLDAAGYKGKDIIGRMIVEPSFGSGAFLKEITRRYIEAGRTCGYRENEISEGLERDIRGIEKDPVLYKEALENVSGLLKNENIPEPDIRKMFILGNSLSEYRCFEGRASYVCGNPPYIQPSALEKATLSEIKNRFPFCKGKTDLYIAFFSLGLLMLNDGGVLSYITPNSYMKNSSEKAFREYLSENRLVRSIYDFGSSLVFEDADTYCAVTVLSMDGSKETELRKYSVIDGMPALSYETYIPGEMLPASGKPWIVQKKDDLAYLASLAKRKNSLCSRYDIRYGCATNLDRVYIHKCYEDRACTTPLGKDSPAMPEYAFFTEKDGCVVKVEACILRPCVKASTFRGEKDNLFIIFPYVSRNSIPCEDNPSETISGGYTVMPEEMLKARFPLAYGYLLKKQDMLKKRDMEVSLPWYAFARSQGLLSMGYPKAVFRHLICGEAETIDTYLLPQEAVVYSGLYMTMKKKGLYIIKDPEGKKLFDREKYLCNLSSGQNIISSNDFSRYAILSGKDKRGGYKEISSRIIGNYRYD